MALCSHGGPRQVFHAPTILCSPASLILTALVVCVLDIDAPIFQTTGGGGAEPSTEQIGLLADMGFSPAQARKALRETVCGLNVVHAPSF
jgi:hypothetical protein